MLAGPQCVRVSLYIVLVSFIFEYNGVHRGYHSPAPTTQRGTQRLTQSCTNNMDSSTAQITKGKPEVSVGGCKFPMYSTEGLPYNGIEIYDFQNVLLLS